jgi:hypothetical protein
MPVIPASWEANVGGSQSEATMGKSRKPYLKNKQEAKGLGCVSSGRVLA